MKKIENNFRLTVCASLVFYLVIVLFGTNSIAIADVTVNVKTDLAGLGCPDGNAVGDGATNDTDAIQWAIDYVNGLGGGEVYVPGPATYLIKGLKVTAHVCLRGDGVDSTVFHAAGSSSYLIRLTNEGSKLCDFTCYGTKNDPNLTGDNWWAEYPEDGAAKGGSGHVINVNQALDVEIRNVKSGEGRFDALYIEDVVGLRVINCEFDRSNRQLVSMVGRSSGGVDYSAEDFLFLNCRFGSYFGNYLFDIEPSGSKPVHDGIFLNCQFDASDMGGMPGTNNNWGEFLVFKGFDSPGDRRDAVILGCEFKKVCIRVNNVWPGLHVICNVIDANECPSSGGRVFFKSWTQPVGEFLDAVILGNTFKRVNNWSDINYDKPEIWDIRVNFSGTSFFACNKPAWANDTPCQWPECNEADLALLESASDINELPFEDLMRLATHCPRELLRVYNRIPVADAGPNQVVYADQSGLVEVTLDGSGSYDPEGDELNYLWTWTIDGNTYEANSASPVIQLPVGEHNIALIVSDRAGDSEPNEVIVTVVPAVEAAMTFTPQSLNCKSKGNWVKAHITLPRGFLREDVNVNKPATAKLSEMTIDSENITVLGGNDGPVRLEIDFDRQAFCELLTCGDSIADDDTLEITVIGILKTGQYFYGSDNIRITRTKRGR